MKSVAMKLEPAGAGGGVGPSPTFSTELDGLLQEYGAYAFDRQVHVQEALGEHAAHFEAGDGTLVLSRVEDGRRVWSRQLPVQVLGLEDAKSGIWRWMPGANTDLPARCLHLAAYLRRFGERRDIEEFRAPELPSGGCLAHSVSLVAAGMMGADAYYRVPALGGTLTVLLRDPSLRPPVDDTLARLGSVFRRFVRLFPVADARKALHAYIPRAGFEMRDYGRYVCALSPAGAVLWAEFDPDGTLQRMLVHSNDERGIHPVADGLRRVA